MKSKYTDGQSTTSMIPVMAENIKLGNHINLEGDFYVDPNMERTEYINNYGTVQSNPKNYNGFILMNIDGKDYVFPANHPFNIVKPNEY